MFTEEERKSLMYDDSVKLADSLEVMMDRRNINFSYGVNRDFITESLRLCNKDTVFVLLKSCVDRGLRFDTTPEVVNQFLDATYRGSFAVNHMATSFVEGGLSFENEKGSKYAEIMAETIGPYAVHEFMETLYKGGLDFMDEENEKMLESLRYRSHKTHELEVNKILVKAGWEFDPSSIKRPKRPKESPSI